jgi:hypothetical protein
MLTVTAWQVVVAVMVGCVQVGGGGVTLMLMVTNPSPVHPFVDVTVTLYDVVTVCVMVMLCVVCPPAHLYVYGAVPPVALAVIVVGVPACTLDGALIDTCIGFVMVKFFVAVVLPFTFVAVKVTVFVPPVE